jgi:hypothetical protein
MAYSIFTKVKNLFIPNKAMTDIKQPGYGTDMRAIEQWAMDLMNNVGAIQEIVGAGGVTITDPFGPVVTVTGGGGGTFYASLTGAGETTSPGDLTQAGGLTVNAGGSNISLNTGAGLINATTSAGSITLAFAGSAGIALASNIATIGVNAINTTWTNTQIQTEGPVNSFGNNVTETFYNPAANRSRWIIGVDNLLFPVIRVDAFGGVSVLLGFFGANPIGQPGAITPPTGGATVDTQARAAIVSILNLLGQASGGYGLTA